MKTYKAASPKLGRRYKQTKVQYPRMACWQVLLAVYKDTKLEWSYDELRLMTGYSVFTLAAALGHLRKGGYTVQRVWEPEYRTHFYKVS